MSKTAHNTPKIAFALSTALVSVALAGCTTSAAPPASASLAKAQAAIEKGKAAKAGEYAEAAVLADPRNASNRALLGAAYLEAGRFQAAATSFGDALALGDTDNRTVLSYALAQTALGNNAEAIRILDQYEGQLDHADRGLALALAGEPRDGVRVLSNALRGGQNTAKVRQNLACAVGRLARGSCDGCRRCAGQSGFRTHRRMGRTDPLASFPNARRKTA